MRKRLIALLSATALVSACSSGPDTNAKEDTTTAASSSASASTTVAEEGFATVSVGETFQVFVETHFPGECNDDVNNGGLEGDCWLPAYEIPSYEGRVLNRNNDPESPCRQVKVAGPTAQAHCWPQPQRSPTQLADSVEVICDEKQGDLEWRAFVLPKERMLIGVSNNTTTFYGNEKKAVVGWNLSKFLRLPEGSDDSKVPDCKF